MAAQVPGVVTYPNLTSQATLQSSNQSSFLIQEFAADLTSAERKLINGYSMTYPKVVVRGRNCLFLSPGSKHRMLGCVCTRCRLLHGMLCPQALQWLCWVMLQHAVHSGHCGPCISSAPCTTSCQHPNTHLLMCLTSPTLDLL